MSYRDYAPEELLLDDSFCNYCLGKTEQDILFWETWIRENPDRASIVGKAKELYFILNGNISREQFEKDRHHFQAAFEEQLHMSPVTSQRKPYRKWTLLAIMSAAVITGLIFLPRLFKKDEGPGGSLNYQYKQTSNTGERKSFQLPDGSKVMLNAGSTIQLVKGFNEATREITLEGEAFFDVSHNPQKPFIIHTRSMDVRVLGTTFNLKAYASDRTTETSLIKGSVEIILKKDNGKKILLKPNEKIILLNDDYPVTKKEMPKQPTPKPSYNIANLTYVDSSLVETSWTQNRLIFNNDRLEDIAVALERWYNVKMVFEDETLKQYSYTAVFDQKTITQILDALQLSRPFSYTISGNNEITLRNESK